MITEAAILAAIKAAPKSGKRSTELRDGGERGSGRLALIIRVRSEAVTSEWYAVWHWSGKRTMSKIGSYPSMNLRDARKRFRESFAPAISVGENPTGPRSRRTKTGITVKKLFEAYAADLTARGATTARAAERVLLGPKGNSGVAKTLGPDTLAGSVTPADITPILSEIYDRGSHAMAAAVRVLVGSVFSFGIKSANDYRKKDNGEDWGIRSNPILSIPTDRNASEPGQRYLRPKEFRAFWRWLETRDSVSQAAPALRIIMATGQRVSEILKVTDVSYDAPERIIDWSKTKNGKQHSIPVPRQAAAILEGLTPNKHGLFFPSITQPTKHMVAGSLLWQTYEYLKATGAQPFSDRDLRRTWRTLSGQAGLFHEIRGRIQNHTMQDVGTTHYYRWQYMEEKRAAMAKWSDFLDRILNGDLDNDVATLKGQQSDRAEA